MVRIPYSVTLPTFRLEEEPSTIFDCGLQELRIDEEHDDYSSVTNPSENHFDFHVNTAARHHIG